MHVKGLELPGYDPRKLKTLALGLAVAARGACHNRSSAYDVDLSDRLDPAADARARAEAAATAEDQAALLDSLTLCKFLRHAIGDVHEEGAALHRAVTGLPTTADDLRAAGAGINETKKRFNVAQGWERGLDTLPPRLLEPNGDGSHIAPEWLERQISAYYTVRGWDEAGQPSATT
jgi:aldehyde:ferredoxin oxidoreductase